MAQDTTKANLKAANDEVRGLMDQVQILKQERDAAYAKGYRDALHVAQDLTKVSQAQAALISFYTRLLVDGINA